MQQKRAIGPVPGQSTQAQEAAERAMVDKLQFVALIGPVKSESSALARAYEIAVTKATVAAEDYNNAHKGTGVPSEAP